MRGAGLRQGCLTAGPDSLNHSEPSLTQLGQIAGGSDGNLLNAGWEEDTEILGPETNTVAKEACTLLLLKVLGQDPKTGFFPKPHRREQNS